MTTRIQSPYFDAARRDLVYEDGDLKADSTQMSDLAIVLGTKHGTATADPSYGNKVWTITKLGNVVPEQARQYCRETVQGRIDSGRISDVQVDAEVQGGWLLAWEVGIVFGPDEVIPLTLLAEDNV